MEVVGLAAAGCIAAASVIYSGVKSGNFVKGKLAYKLGKRALKSKLFKSIKSHSFELFNETVEKLKEFDNFYETHKLDKYVEIIGEQTGVNLKDMMDDYDKIKEKIFSVEEKINEVGAPLNAIDEERKEEIDNEDKLVKIVVDSHAKSFQLVKEKYEKLFKQVDELRLTGLLDDIEEIAKAEMLKKLPQNIDIDRLWKIQMAKMAQLKKREMNQRKKEKKANAGSL